MLATEQAWQPVEVDGHPGREHGGLPQCNFTEAAVFVDGRMYSIEASPNPHRIVYRVFDPALFDAILSTIRFDPASATTPAAKSRTQPELTRLLRQSGRSSSLGGRPGWQCPSASLTLSSDTRQQGLGMRPARGGAGDGRGAGG